MNKLLLHIDIGTKGFYIPRTIISGWPENATIYSKLTNMLGKCVQAFEKPVIMPLNFAYN